MKTLRRTIPNLSNKLYNATAMEDKKVFPIKELTYTIFTSVSQVKTGIQAHL
jgi:hypothetical protein